MAHARHEIEQGERFLEFRLDYLRSPDRGIDAIKSLIEEFPDLVFSPPAAERKIMDISQARLSNRPVY